MTSRFTHSHKASQRGAILIVSLLMLLVMTLIGVTAVSTTTLQEKMAGNNRQRQLAFQAASSALRGAETWLETNITTVAAFETTFSGTPDELYWLRAPKPPSPVRAVAMDIYDSSVWAVGNSQQAANPVASGGQNPPRYIIEYMGRSGEAPLDYTDPDTRQYAFRITAIGWGTDNTTTYIAQSTFRIPLT
jgi:type IV pilus assembly protein PilX